MTKIVIALGGNALGNTPAEQIDAVQETAKAIQPLLTSDNQVVICHGNGPQVGMINLAFEDGHEADETPLMPLAECTAMSQGYIGYHLQNALDRTKNVKQKTKNDEQCGETASGSDSENNQSLPSAICHLPSDKPITNQPPLATTVITRCLVDADDPGFLNPTKPIGSFYSKEQAEQFSQDTGYRFIEDSGRGWRRVVASPKPLAVLEIETVKQLLDQGQTVIAGGGGGIPVVEITGAAEASLDNRTASDSTSSADNHQSPITNYVRADAVIDKDFCAELIAELIDADYLFILTAVEKVAINFGQHDQKWLDRVTVKDLRKYAAEGHFAPGSMLPKVEAALKFVESGRGNAVITSLEKAAEALAGRAGTVVVSD
ncbi:MAG: carbamate kinase [Bifidobacteriaceae bacterium]|jgi:carbamate kinase|nr:carbamate kinase [Bifidobacteriaceae bacterium]